MNAPVDGAARLVGSANVPVAGGTADHFVSPYWFIPAAFAEHYAR